MIAVSETSVSASIKQYLDARHIWNIRINSGKVKVNGGWMQLAAEGTPDRLALFKGKSIWIEVKTIGGKLSAAQIEMHRRIISAGGFVIVAETLDEFITEFKKASRNGR